jgi:hypothetical protein
MIPAVSPTGFPYLLRIPAGVLYPNMGNRDQGHTMDTGSLSVLMVISLGAMTGTAIGLIIGKALKKQERDWSAMTNDERTGTIGLIIICSLICCAALAWYSLQTPLV